MRMSRPTEASSAIVFAITLAIGAGIAAGCRPSTSLPDGAPPAPTVPATEASTSDDAGATDDAAADEGWLRHGRTDDEQRFSPLDQIDETNVASLGLAWQFDLETTHGVEATPLVVEDTMFVTGPWSVVHALDARTGRLRWQYDPRVPRRHALSACCGVVNRGVAAHAGRIFVGTLDGRLVALDAGTGERIWETQTVDPDQPYSITGAPRVVRGLVVIGNGGAEYGVRGYVSAYHAETGALAWRTYTVPGDPAKPFESEAMERAAAT